MEKSGKTWGVAPTKVDRACRCCLRNFWRRAKSYFSGEQRSPSDPGQSNLRPQKVSGQAKLLCCPLKRIGAGSFIAFPRMSFLQRQGRQSSDRLNLG
jgi:hypothetical protein